MLTAERVLKMLPKAAHKAAKRDILKVQLVHGSALVGCFLGGAAIVGLPTWTFFAHTELIGFELAQAAHEIGAFFMAPFGALVGGLFGVTIGNFVVGELHQDALSDIANSHFVDDDDDDEMWGW